MFRGVRSLLLFLAASNLYAAVLLSAVVVRYRQLFTGSEFSLGRYYVLMGWAPFAFLALGVLADVRYLFLFALGGVAGIAGEVAVSLLWRRYFREPIWTYSYRSVLRGYTSTINFLPWSVGALLFVETGRLVQGTPSLGLSPRAVLVSAVAFGVGLACAWPARRFTAAGSGRFSRSALAVFALPVATTALALGVWCSPRYPLMMVAFAIVGFVTEYAYGRGMSLFFERGLWTYNHWRIDEGHTSFVTLPLWALGGLCFYFIAGAIGL